MSKANARYRRSIVLGVMALASLVWVATEQFDLPREDMAWLLVYTLVGLLFVIVAAAVVAGLWIGLRRLFGGS